MDVRSTLFAFFVLMTAASCGLQTEVYVGPAEGAATVATASFGAVNGTGPGAVPETAVIAAAPRVAPARAAAPRAPAAVAPVPRRKDWPELDAWLRGEDVSTEPEMCPADETKLVDFGARIFKTYCKNCHGEEGRGDGPRSPLFNPVPRDLTHGVFKFRSTASGAPPTREDLFRVISSGLRGTGMIPFADLPEEERWALVAYVRKLALHSVEDEDPEDIFAVPAVPGDLDSARRRARGKKVYAKLKCADCHGETGRGDGPSAPTLKDENGKPLPPPDFATRPLKRKDDPAEMYLTILTGLDGTPMPSYPLELVSVARYWDLVAYIDALRDGIGSEVDPLDRDEAAEFIKEQYAAAVHAVVDGCGCNAKAK